MWITEELWHWHPTSAHRLLSHLQFSSSGDWALCRALRIQKLMKPPYPRCLGFHILLPRATPPFPAPITSLAGVSDTSSAAPTSATKSGPSLGYCRNPLSIHTHVADTMPGLSFIYFVLFCWRKARGRKLRNIAYLQCLCGRQTITKGQETTRYM